VLTPLLVWLQQAALQPPSAAAPASPVTGVFGELLRVLVVLALISAAAFWALRWVARRGGFGAVPPADAGVSLRVLARLPLEPRKALYLVRVGERTLLLGTGEGGPPSLLIDLGRAGAAPDAAHAANAAQAAQPEPAATDSAMLHASGRDRADG
jgi:flagellar biogenesis protein FliO